MAGKCILENSLLSKGSRPFCTDQGDRLVFQQFVRVLFYAPVPFRLGRDIEKEILLYAHRAEDFFFYIVMQLQVL